MWQAAAHSTGQAASAFVLCSTGAAPRQAAAHCRRCTTMAGQPAHEGHAEQELPPARLLQMQHQGWAAHLASWLLR